MHDLGSFFVTKIKPNQICNIAVDGSELDLVESLMHLIRMPKATSCIVIRCRGMLTKLCYSTTCDENVLVFSPNPKALTDNIKSLGYTMKYA